MTDVDFTLPATSNCVSSPWSCWSATSFSTRLSTCSHHWRHLPPQRGCQHLTPPRPARGCCPPSEGDRIVTNKRFHWKFFFFLFLEGSPLMKMSSAGSCGSGQRVYMFLCNLCRLSYSFLSTFSVWHKNRLTCASHSKHFKYKDPDFFLLFFLSLHNVPFEWLSF